MTSTAHPTLTFTLPDGSTSTTTVRRLLNAGYAGQDQAEVQAHIRELAELGVPAPSTSPTLYPVSPYLAQQTDIVYVQHSTTSGEAEWALIIDDDGRQLLTVACDHTDRALETHGVAWSKNAAPDVLGTVAFPLDELPEDLSTITLQAWVTHNGDSTPTLIQDSTAGALLSPSYWLDILHTRGEDTPGTILVSGTVTMLDGVDQFADRWKVELTVPGLGSASVDYDVREMATPID
ncbi:DUF2848 domain-containing protein [Corynebacterium uropygiale]|uniref:DUF2848 domain-containing protein n=1 Tax=Corynebacterium uropygiale TaxID=1775911 RepID=A0A9X1QQC0_9CORY|nr:DUF2848 family protein [Corynebacterium uropygiale]MCF4007707.1 DUF2848 domain-containing protein [Corynebacterium uropygiale]